MVKEKLAKRISEILGIDKNTIESFLEKPKASYGDIALPCFKLIKLINKKPEEIAKLIKEKLELEEIKKIDFINPYINFFIDYDKIGKKLIKEILADKNYGSLNIGKGKRMLIEHTSINPNASPHVGRARNAIIGDALARLFSFNGFDVETHYFVNDIGKQIAMLVYACKERENLTFKDMLNIYVEINKKLKENPELEKEIFSLLNKLEKGDEETIKQFRNVVDICIKGQFSIFKELDIKFNFVDYESKYVAEEKTKEILNLFEKTGRLFKDEEGRYVLNLKALDADIDKAMKSPVLVLTRADGTSLYPLRDIAYTIEKLEKEKENNIIVLGEDQKLYYKQIKAALKLIKLDAPKVVHYSYVLIKIGKEKTKMSTRRGELVLLEDFMKEAYEKAREEILKRHKKISKEKLENLARKIGFSAVKYAIIKVAPEKNVIFDWQHALNFEGDSAAYLLYVNARINSILRKAGSFKLKDNLIFKEKEEIEIIKKLLKFKEEIEYSLKNLKVNNLANYCYELSKSFNEFYHSCPVLKAEEPLKSSRIALILAVQRVLLNCLNILGLFVVEEM